MNSPQSKIFNFNSVLRMLRRALPFLIVVLVIELLAILYYIPKQVKFPPRPATPTVNVQTLSIQPVPEMADTIRLPAVVEANRTVTVAAEVVGRIENIPVEEGARVKEGDLLLKLNTDLLQAEYNRAAAQVKYDESEYARKEALVQGGAVPGRELDEAESKLAISKAQLDEVRARLERAIIKAPISGTLNRIPVELGEYVQAGTPVAEIVDHVVVKVVVHVPERDVPYFQEGSASEIMTTIRGEEIPLNGTITYISATADPMTRSSRMELTVPNEDNLLRSGQIVDVRLTRRILKNVIMIPLMAVIPLENGKAVFINNSGKAKRSEVELGLIRGRDVQILSGLEPGDQLIVAGHRLVGPDQPLHVAKPE